MTRCSPNWGRPMHELAVCQALLRQLEEIAQTQDATRVTQVVVQIGALSGVEPELLRQAYPVASAGSIADQAELILETTPIRVHCRTCGADSSASLNRLLCAACGDYHTELISGDELLLSHVELETAADTAACH